MKGVPLRMEVSRLIRLAGLKVHTRRGRTVRDPADRFEHRWAPKTWRTGPAKWFDATLVRRWRVPQCLGRARPGRALCADAFNSNRSELATLTLRTSRGLSWPPSSRQSWTGCTVTCSARSSRPMSRFHRGTCAKSALSFSATVCLQRSFSPLFLF